MHVPFSGRRKPTPRFVRIVRMQDSESRIPPHHPRGAAGGVYRELTTANWTTTMTRVRKTRKCRCHPLLLSTFSLPLSSAPVYDAAVLPMRLGSDESCQTLFLPRHRVLTCVPPSRPLLKLKYPAWACTAANIPPDQSHTFCLPVIGGIGSLLPRHAGVHAGTLESEAGRSSASVSSSSSSPSAAHTDFTPYAEVCYYLPKQH
jgi:hypothetical protein